MPDLYGLLRPHFLLLDDEMRYSSRSSCCLAEGTFFF